METAKSQSVFKVHGACQVDFLPFEWPNSAPFDIIFTAKPGWQNWKMARDLVIYGIVKNDFTDRLRMKFSDWLLSTEESAEFLKAFKSGISISTKVLLEEYLWGKKHLTIEEQHLNLGVKELVSYRSKNICLAIAQLISYYNDELITQFTQKSKIETHDGCLILNKDTTLRLLDWLIAVGLELNLDFKNQSQLRFSKELRQEAEKFVRKELVGRSEFDFYGDELFNIVNWKQGIVKTEFDFYYWQDSN